MTDELVVVNITMSSTMNRPKHSSISLFDQRVMKGKLTTLSTKCTREIASSSSPKRKRGVTLDLQVGILEHANGKMDHP